MRKRFPSMKALRMIPLPWTSSRTAPAEVLILTGALAGFMVQAETPHRFILKYEGSQTCTRCHESAAREVMATVHWTWSHTDPASGQQLGKNHVINNYCIAIASNEPRCTSCHVGLGYADKTFDFSDPTKVDCLVCHDTTGTYKKFPTGAGHPVYDTPKEFPAGSGNIWPPVDLLYVARNVGKTSRATCGACHFYGGGGDAVKHGDLDSTMTNPTRELDVHMGVDGLNFSCAVCHNASEHRITGTSYPSTTTDDQLCQKCHGPAPHRNNPTLNSHLARVACQTCHIPAFARGGKATKMTWDWSTAGQKGPDGKNKVVKDAAGNPIYDTQKGSFTWQANVVPEYRWSNGDTTFVTLDTPVSAAERVTINRLHGSVADPKARIMPVKRFTGRQPYDAGRGRLVVPHLFGSDPDAYWKSYDWTRAVIAGQAYIGREFLGPVGFVETEMFWVQNHMVAPKEKALRCTDCHVPGGRLDFLALGYAPERAARLQTLAGFEISEVRVLPGVGRLKLAWTGTPGYRYQVQVSSDLKQWSDAPDGLRVSGTAATPLAWDEPLAATSARFYRILRLNQ